MDTQGPEAVDPADQWVLDPATGEYRLRTGPPPAAAGEGYAAAYPAGAPDAGAFTGAGASAYAGADADLFTGADADPFASDGFASDGFASTGFAGAGPGGPTGPGSGGFTGPGPGGFDGADARARAFTGADPGAYGDPFSGGGAGASPGGHAGGFAGAGEGAGPRADTVTGMGTVTGMDRGGVDAGTGGTGADGGAFAPSEPSPATGPRTDGSSRAAVGGGRRRAAGRSGRRKPRGRGPGGRPVLVWAAGGVGLVLVLGGVGVAVAQRHSGGPSVHAVDVGDAAAPTLDTRGPMNVLLINAAGGAAPGGGQARGQVAGADSAVLLHLSADRHDATAVTIPGDLVTAIPDCPVRRGDGTTSVVRGTPVNGASPTFRQSLGVQGRDPGCTMRTVDRLTGVKVDHFVLADTRAIQELTTAAGGVPVCLKDPLSDPAAHLDLAAGRHTLTAAQAPGFLTTRSAPPGHGVLDGARLQQAYFGALLRQWKAGGAPVDKALADASARTLTVDPALARSGALDTLRGEIGKVDVTHVTFAALPTAKAAGGATTAALDSTAAKQLFTLVTRDVPLSAEPPAPDPKLAGPKATPHNTRVTVLNGTGDFGASQDVLNWLQNDKGVNRSANGGDAPATLAATRLDYAPNQADQARSLAAMMGLPASALHEGTKDVPPLTYMTLTLGKDYTSPGTPIALPLAPPKGLETSTADSTACVG